MPETKVEEKPKHHIAENGRHLVIHLKRVPPFNVGEVAGYPAHIAEQLCSSSMVNGKLVEPAAELAARVITKKPLDHRKYLGSPGSEIPAGSIIAVSANDADALVKAGDAEYVTPAHIAQKKAEQKSADDAHAAEAASALTAAMKATPRAQANK